MKGKKAYLWALLICLAPFLAFFLWNDNTPNGAEIDDKRPFLGCYTYRDQIVVRLENDKMLDDAGNTISQVRRMLHLKRDEVVNTVGELFFDPAKGAVDAGERKTGFFYTFQKRGGSVSLLLPDRDGKVHELNRAECPR
ncbi:hypothetical protein MOK15_09805 [Sphingobium sp. BYY-5]|uniref:hypothetical protein n=1 Tax=Sphingobium sp. BYY-5 TaxID=2926400 RepID=UPI001FA6BEFC|nr:hypothetical protein [Sphingobium sp. BYY-5]MCI4590387.1 hypothetical protein [Sphingobium sp. BYY-5]